MRAFPIFVSFEGKPPLVAGGGSLALIKARLLLLRAESVELFAESVSPELAALVAEGKLVLSPGPVDAEHLRGRPLVIAATEDEAEDARISALARELGVPVNVPDRPELCSFILPAIVDRGEVTVAIGTAGASPVLAQRLRAWLEHELHPLLDRLARLAADFRDRVADRLPPGPPRRRFWEGVMDGDPAKAALEGDEDKARRLIEAALDQAANAEPAKGRVLLIGAGPGDPELVTLKAVRALKSADVVLYDRLVGEGVLGHARREAELISVGKEHGRHAISQDEINALLVEHARQGKVVVRLKGGDPLIFGRGGEELEALRKAGIEVEVVPGVTAMAAASATLQIPLTHRDLSHTVTLVSGHVAGGKEPRFEHIDFKALAPDQNTVALYMGVATANLFAAKLIEAGWRPGCPVIAVENASTPNERRVATTIGELADHAEGLGLRSPAILLFGEVAGVPAAGLVEEVLSLPEVKRVYA
jgi:uroporphyrin-III C-methyltransferase / precorrin-2 dehydrogenase / sirohydrochlorin ferrochelatase